MPQPDDPDFAPGWAEPPASPGPVPADERPAPDGATRNVLLDPVPVKYAVERTGFGVWRRHVTPEGRRFSEFTSHRHFGRLPAVHMTFGRDLATGKKKTARGVVAVGQWAVGVFAAGQFATGAFVLAQFGLGLVLCAGQFGVGLICAGQFALGGLFAVGQFAAAAAAVGVLAVGNVAVGVWGWGGAVCDLNGCDPVARQWVRIDVWVLAPGRDATRTLAKRPGR